LLTSRAHRVSGHGVATLPLCLPRTARPESFTAFAAFTVGGEFLPAFQRCLPHTVRVPERLSGRLAPSALTLLTQASSPVQGRSAPEAYRLGAKLPGGARRGGLAGRAAGAASSQFITAGGGN
jgi:hypothetical protein